MKYFDGKTSSPHECVATIEHNDLVIDLGHSQLRWPISEIMHTEFQGIGKTSVQFGAFPHQTLEFEENTGFAYELNGMLPKRREGFFAFANELVHSGMRGAVIIFICVCSALLGVYFYLLPTLAENLALALPLEQEIKLGNLFFEQITSDYKVDSVKSKAVNDFAKTLNFDTEYPIHFTVVNESQVNAFALPGGEIVIFDQMLKELDKPEELVALMSHEANHVILRHSLKGISRDISGSLFINVVFGGGGDLAGTIFKNASGIVGLKYSRNLEKEADLQGLALMKRNKVDQKGMLNLMQKLQKEEDKMGINIPQYLSTHPIGKNRIAYLTSEIKNADVRPFDSMQSKLWAEIKK